jgi:hypothetical protein
MPLTVATPLLGARLGARRRQHPVGCASRRHVAPRAVGVAPDARPQQSPTFASPSQTVNSVKTRIVVLGTGWAAVSFLKQLSSGAGVDVTVVRWCPTPTAATRAWVTSDAAAPLALLAQPTQLLHVHAP